MGEIGATYDGGNGGIMTLNQSRISRYVYLGKARCDHAIAKKVH